MFNTHIQFYIEKKTETKKSRNILKGNVKLNIKISLPLNTQLNFLIKIHILTHHDIIQKKNTKESHYYCDTL